MIADKECQKSVLVTDTPLTRSIGSHSQGVSAVTRNECQQSLARSVSGHRQEVGTGSGSFRTRIGALLSDPSLFKFPVTPHSLATPQRLPTQESPSLHRLLSDSSVTPR